MTLKNQTNLNTIRKIAQRSTHNTHTHTRTTCYSGLARTILPLWIHNFVSFFLTNCCCFGARLCSFFYERLKIRKIFANDRDELSSEENIHWAANFKIAIVGCSDKRHELYQNFNFSFAAILITINIVERTKFHFSKIKTQNFFFLNMNDFQVGQWGPYQFWVTRDSFRLREPSILVLFHFWIHWILKSKNGLMQFNEIEYTNRNMVLH